MEPECSLPFSQQPGFNPYSQSAKSGPRPYILSKQLRYASNSQYSMEHERSLPSSQPPVSGSHPRWIKSWYSHPTLSIRPSIYVHVSNWSLSSKILYQKLCMNFSPFIFLLYTSPISPFFVWGRVQITKFSSCNFRQPTVRSKYSPHRSQAPSVYYVRTLRIGRIITNQSSERCCKDRLCLSLMLFPRDRFWPATSCRVS
jgi:hypothetical protein